MAKLPPSFIWPTKSRQAAIELAEQGFHIIPCLAMDQQIRGRLYKAKRPQPGFSWKEQCSNDPSKIATWFRGIYANSIPGIAIGRDDLVIVDLDISKDGGPDGRETWKRLIKGRDLPEFIPEVKTQAGGSHLYFKQPKGGKSLGNREGKLAKSGINIRGENGYVIGPGTMMPNGARYEFVNCGIADLRHAPEIPAWLIELIEGTEAPEEKGEPSEHDIDANPARERAYIKAAIDGEIEKVRTSKVDRNNQLNTSAFCLAQMVAKGWLSRSQAESLLMRACEANGLLKEDGRKQCYETINSGFKGAAQKSPRPDPKFKPSGPQEPEGATAEPQKPSASPGATSGRQKAKAQSKAYLYSAELLMGQEFEPLKFIVDGLIPEGLTIMAGRPKIGKSWLALDLAISVATGGKMLGRQCVQGDVAYLALEDSPRRMKSRIMAQYPETGVRSKQLRIAHDWPRGEEAVTWLEDWRASVENPALAIVDTLIRVRQEPKNGKSEGYREDYESVSMLQKFSISAGVPVIVIHHDRKSEADDIFDTISGTLGLNGAADSMVIIYRQKGTGSIMLAGRGRDMDDYSHLMKFNKETFKWELGGKVDEVVYSGTKKKILEILRATVAALSIKDIADKCGFGSKLVQKTLERMASDGLVLKAERGHYVAAEVAA